MSSLLSKFLTSFKLSSSAPALASSSRHSRIEDAELPPNPPVTARTSKKKSRGRYSSSGTRGRIPLSFSRRLKLTLRATRHLRKSVNPPTATAPRSTQPRLTRSLISSLNGLPTIDEEATHVCFSPLPSNPAVTSKPSQGGELDATTLVSEKSRGESSSTHNHPEPGFGLSLKGYSEAITVWVRELLDQYTHPEDSEYSCWVHNQRIVEWRRYRVRRKINKFHFGSPDSHEFLVVKLKGQNETETTLLRFERYIRDRSIDCARGRNYRPLYWQRWDPDDRVMMLDQWPDEGRYGQCERQAFYRKEHRFSLLDLLIAAHLAAEAPWTDFSTRHDHWFAVLLGRMLNGRMEKTHRLKQPVARSVVEKYGGTQGKDWFRASNGHERRKIVELIHLCCVIRHEEKTRLLYGD